jgi:hypothetical protein
MYNSFVNVICYNFKNNEDVITLSFWDDFSCECIECCVYCLSCSHTVDIFSLVFCWCQRKGPSLFCAAVLFPDQHKCWLPARNKPFLVLSFSQQQKQQYNAGEMGYRYPKRTGRRAEPLFWNAALIEHVKYVRHRHQKSQLMTLSFSFTEKYSNYTWISFST